MRFADSLFRTFLGGACVALASSCAILSGPETPKPDSAPAQTPPAPMAKAAPVAKAPAAPAQDTAPSAPGAVGQAEPATAEEAEPPLSPEVQRNFEWARRALIAGKLDDAERGFLELTKSNPELGGAFANLGIVYRHKKKFEESVTALEHAVQANPKQPVYFNQLGISYRMVGQFTKARDAYEKAIALDPNYALAILNLGILYDVYLWDGRRALELYDRYLSLSPGGDDKVKKWASDLRNRNTPRSLASRKEEG
jgi:tetratricopeptide (TPR) repeat protein